MSIENNVTSSRNSSGVGRVSTSTRKNPTEIKTASSFNDGMGGTVASKTPYNSFGADISAPKVSYDVERQAPPPFYRTDQEEMQSHAMARTLNSTYADASDFCDAQAGDGYTALEDSTIISGVINDLADGYGAEAGDAWGEVDAAQSEAQAMVANKSMTPEQAKSYVEGQAELAKARIKTIAAKYEARAAKDLGDLAARKAEKTLDNKLKREAQEIETKTLASSSQETEEIQEEKAIFAENLEQKLEKYQKPKSYERTQEEA